MPGSDQDLEWKATEREARQAGVDTSKAAPYQEYLRTTDPYVKAAERLNQPYQTIAPVTIEGDPQGEEKRLQEAQAEVDAQIAANQDIPAAEIPGASGQGAGGFVSRISPETRQAYQRAYGTAYGTIPVVEERSQEAVSSAEDLRRTQYEAGRREVQEQADRAWGQYHQTQDELKRAQDVYASARDEHDAAVKDIRETKSDPSQFWTKHDAFTNVLIAVNGALGGFFQVYTGQNPAMDSINRGIDAEIRAQEVDLKKKEGVADTLLRRNMMMLRDLDAARERTRIQLLEITRLSAQKMAMDQGNADALGRFQKLSADISSRADQATADLGLRYADFMAASEGRAGTSQAAGLKEFIKEGKERDKAFVSVSDPVTGELLIEGIAQGGAGVAAELRDKIAPAVTTMIQDFQDARDIRRRLISMADVIKKNGGSPLADSRYIDLDRKFSELTAAKNIQQGMGAISHDDQRRAEAAVTRFVDLSTDEAEADKALDHALEDIRRGFRRRQGISLNPGRRVQVQDPHGPRGIPTTITVDATSFRTRSPGASAGPKSEPLTVKRGD